MKVLTIVLWAAVVVWFGNLLVVSDWRGRWQLLGVLLVPAVLAVLVAWAVRHPHGTLARRLSTPVGPGLESRRGRTGQLRSAGWFFTWAAGFGLATFVVSSGLLQGNAPRLQTLAIWAFPFVGFGTVLAFAAGTLSLARGLLNR